MALTSNGLIRTDTGRNDIEFVDTLAYNSSYNILKRTGTGRSDIAWESINTGSDTSGVTAGTSDVLDGKYFVNSAGSRLAGTMQNQGAKTASLNCGGSYTIPKGYHNGSGKVTANSLSSQTSANATAADIVSGKTAWVNGRKITGTKLEYKSLNYSITCASKQKISCYPCKSGSDGVLNRGAKQTVVYKRSGNDMSAILSGTNWANSYAIICQFILDRYDTGGTYTSNVHDDYVLIPGKRSAEIFSHSNLNYRDYGCIGISTTGRLIDIGNVEAFALLDITDTHFILKMYAYPADTSLWNVTSSASLQSNMFNLQIKFVSCVV